MPTAVEGDAALTRTGQALGTPEFMSPEQAAGHLEAVGPRSDVYRLGATLYYLLTGKAPFASTELAVMLANVQIGEFPSPRDKNKQVPKSLEAICLKAMSRRPTKRYSSRNPPRKPLADRSPRLTGLCCHRGRRPGQVIQNVALHAFDFGPVTA